MTPDFAIAATAPTAHLLDTSPVHGQMMPIAHNFESWSPASRSLSMHDEPNIRNSTRSRTAGLNIDESGNPIGLNART